MNKYCLLLLACFVLNSINAQDGCRIQSLYQTSQINCEDYEHGDWILVFEDDFNGGQLDTNVWFTCEDGWINVHGEELQIYLKDNISIQNGILRLVAKEEPDIYNHWTYLPDDSLHYTQGFFQYTSGWIQTKKHFLYGKIEVRCKIPNGTGFWPAFWMFGKGYEIDIFEFACEDPYTCLFNVHNWENDGHFACTGRYTDNSNDFSDDYHTYSIEWDEFHLIYRIDGVERRRISRYSNSLGITIDDCRNIPEYNNIWDKQVFPRNPMPIILNLAVSSGECGAPPTPSTVFPSSLDIDYVRVYKRTNPDRTTIINEHNDSVFACYTSGDIYMRGEDSIYAIDSNDRLSLFATNEIEIGAEVDLHYGSEVDFCIVSSPSYLPNGSNDFVSESIDSTATNQSEDPQEQNESTIHISPNPTTGYFSLEINENWSEYHHLRIINGFGETVYTSKIGERSSYSFHLRLPKGIYSVILEGSLGTRSKTLIIQ